MSFEFFQPGVYYFSDHNFNEAAEYIGTIIVKPKQVEHFIEISTEGFSPGKIKEYSYFQTTDASSAKCAASKGSEEA